LVNVVFTEVIVFFVGGEGDNKSDCEFSLEDFWLKLRTYFKTRHECAWTIHPFFYCYMYVVGTYLENKLIS
jgi:hypothetical protein